MSNGVNLSARVPGETQSGMYIPRVPPRGTRDLPRGVNRDFVIYLGGSPLIYLGGSLGEEIYPGGSPGEEIPGGFPPGVWESLTLPNPATLFFF